MKVTLHETKDVLDDWKSRLAVPWMEKLDVERVRDFIQAKCDADAACWNLDELKELL